LRGERIVTGSLPGRAFAPTQPTTGGKMSTILTPGELSALRVLAKRHIRRAPRIGEKPMDNAVSALDKLERLPDGFPARIAPTGLRRLEIHDADTRDALASELGTVVDMLHEIAERYGVGDAGAAWPAELMAELTDATVDRFDGPVETGLYHGA
jgi:hypothetical protein